MALLAFMAFLFYADPGSGMMLLQLLLAFFGGVLFYFRSFFSRLFSRNKTPQPPPAEKLQEIESEHSDKTNNEQNEV
jgi:hypothetical protein